MTDILEEITREMILFESNADCEDADSLHSKINAIFVRDYSQEN